MGRHKLGASEDLFQSAPHGRIFFTALTSPGKRIESSRPVKCHFTLSDSAAMGAIGLYWEYRKLKGKGDRCGQRLQPLRDFSGPNCCARQKLLNIQTKAAWAERIQLNIEDKDFISLPSQQQVGTVASPFGPKPF